MRKLYQRLALVLSMSAVLTMLIFTVSLYGRSRAENIHYLRQLLDGVEENLSHNSEDYRERLELLEEDYLKRARAAEYILSSGPGLVSEEELQIIKELMEVRAVTVIGNSGEILMSTEDETGDGSEESVFYVTVKAQSDRFAAVRVDADPGRLGLMDWEDLMRSTLRQATTEHRTGILAVDPETGEIIGFTRNNAQDFELAGIDTASEFLELLESMADRRAAVLRVNEVYQRVLVRETEGYYLVAFSALDTVFADMTWSFWEGLIGIGAVSTAAILLVRYYLKKYLFRHFETVKEDISRVLAGAAGSGAADAGIPEVQAFVAAISELEKGYLDQAEGMHRMEDELSRARTEAERDKLTGLYNRRGMEKRVEIFLKQETPAGTFVLFDLDNFKRVNDSEGHPEGDRVLERFAACLRECFRKGDSLGRLGGDEFAALISGPVPDERLEEIFCAVMSGVREKLRTYYKKYGVSVSIGAVPVDGTVRSYKGLYKCADTALYIAKYLGKDRCYINKEKISCMKKECIRCRENCPRSRLLDLKSREE
ncbi:MAG TPA: GGDEF domain-containing protein [Candidatus Mediterraneibacter tabaqchaliae]|uniref:GGDEF domain-containing protein n=1 Tax=Candidatus Mediterraneibacter tabaqchaliae TaxID=2838689 RepID=A0A9D2U3R5_9FIRM|nr:GGDEF domain-containing protein [Candidatus Mediterraneibacter tabaqchaliae]